jgi:hypothetical protein
MRRPSVPAGAAVSIVLCLTLRPAAALEVPADMDASLRRYAAVVEATVTAAPPAITLHFLDAADGLPYEVRRRLHGSVDWGPALAELPAGTTSWLDDTVSLGVAYEYQVRKIISPTETAFGYLASGIAFDRSEPQGRMILLLDSTMVTPLAAEIERLVSDLTGDGWFVVTLQAPRVEGYTDQSLVAQVKQQIVDAWQAAPADDKPRALFILGHVPVPRSGLDGRPPDGHDEHRGALAADSYYADIDGLWTDLGSAPVGVDSDQENVPGDLRFDQDYLPSGLELAFGRVDLADLYQYGDTTEVELLRGYLDKLHAFRHVEAGFDAGQRSAFANGYIESVEMCWRTLPGISGADDTEFVTFTEIDAAGGPVAWVNTHGPLLIFEQNMRAPDVTDHIDHGSNAVLWSSDQSAFGLWARGGNPIRAVLAGPGLNLAWVWHVSPSYVFIDVAMGGTLGEAVRRTAEHSASNLLFERPERDYDDSLVYNRQYITLHGDPTLRLFQVAPPAGLEASLAGGSVTLSWNPSPALDLVGYHVYRAADVLGPFVRITGASPVTTTSFTDSDPLTGPATYMVRAIKLQTSGGGTFLNPSQGLFVAAPESAIFADDFESGDLQAWSQGAL